MSLLTLFRVPPLDVRAAVGINGVLVRGIAINGALGAAPMTTITIPQGDTVVIYLAVTESDGVTAVNVTDYTITFMAKRHYTDSDAEAVIAKSTAAATISYTDPTIGLVQTILNPSDTDALRGQTVQLVYDWRMRSPAGAVYMVARGTIVVTPAVAQTV